MKYKKEHIKPNGRKLLSGGPRDLQRRQLQSETVIDHSDVINELKNEIARLSNELKERPVTNGFSGEQVDNEIRSAVTEAIGNLKEEIKERNERENNLASDLKKKEKELEKAKDEHTKQVEKLLKEQNRKLEELTTSVLNGQRTGSVEIESDRPKMETVFIDPLEKDAGKDLESFIVKDISVNERENMFEKVDKLKGMLGKLPSKK